MRLCFEGERFDLAGGQAVGLRDQQGVQVEVLRGDLWVTQEGDRRDLIFGNGDLFEVERGGITVLHALTPTQIRVEETPGARSRATVWWRRLKRRLDEARQRAARSRAYRL